MPRLSLPPIYDQEAVAEDGDAFETACRRAARGGAGALFAWADTPARATAAIVLEPDRPAAEAAKAVYVAMVGAGDALGALIPPAVPMLFVWPDRIELDGGLIGGVRLAGPDAAGPGGAPDWMVVGIDLAVEDASGTKAPGDRPDRTSLHGEGCGDVSARMVLESFSRHFLYWTNRWQQDGFAPIQASWLPRARGREAEAGFAHAGGPPRARIAGLDRDGGLVLKRPEDGATTVLPLAAAVAAPTWRP